MMKRAVVLTLAAAIVVAAAGIALMLTTRPSPSEPIRIGFLGPLSGPFAPWGINHRDGMLLAVEELNGRGGVLGRKLELVVRDDRNSPSEAISAFRELVEVQGVVAVAGPVSSDIGLALSKEAERYKVPLFLLAAGSDRVLTRSSRYTFRTCLPSASMHEQLFEEFIRSMNVKRVANVIADYEWGHSIREAVERVAARTGIELRTEVAPLTESDFTPYLRRLKDLNPELIIATGHPPGLAAIVKQSLEVGINAKWITGSVPPATPLVSALGELAFGRVLLTNCANYESSEYVALAEKFRERFGALMEQFAVAGYVTVMMIADAIEKTGSTDPKTIADHVRKGRYVSPLYLWPLSYTEWGELKEARMSFAVIEKGDPPGRVNPGSGWHLRTFFVTSEPVKPYVPKG
jgi:branched-chain amino acid transport system substrate-binding protein